MRKGERSINLYTQFIFIINLTSKHEENLSSTQRDPRNCSKVHQEAGKVEQNPGEKVWNAN